MVGGSFYSGQQLFLFGPISDALSLTSESSVCGGYALAISFINFSKLQIINLDTWVSSNASPYAGATFRLRGRRLRQQISGCFDVSQE